MKNMNKIGWVGLVAIGMGSSSYAAGTSAGTTIENNASVVYEINSVTQPAVTAPTADSFIVDAKVNVLVVGEEAAAVAVNPGEQDVVASYSVENIGNDDTVVYALSYNNLKDGDADNFNFSTLTFNVDMDGDGTYELTGVTEIALLSDATASIQIEGDVPSAAVQGSFNNYELILTPLVSSGGAVVVNDTAADDKGIKDYVVLDGTADASAGIGSGTFKGPQPTDETFKVNSVSLSISKTSTIISDPFNGTTNPKRIPGALVEYIITIDATGSDVPAEGVVVTDDLSSIIANVAFQLAYYNGSASDVRIVTDIGGAATETFQNSAYNNATDEVSINVPDVAVDTATTVSFVVEIQ